MTDNESEYEAWRVNYSQTHISRMNPQDPRPTQSEEGWRERFNAKFVGNIDLDIVPTQRAEDLRDFIAQEITAAEKHTAERVRREEREFIAENIRRYLKYFPHASLEQYFGGSLLFAALSEKAPELPDKE